VPCTTHDARDALGDAGKADGLTADEVCEARIERGRLPSRDAAGAVPARVEGDASMVLPWRGVQALGGWGLRL
jgi:hypothetical protein